MIFGIIISVCILCVAALISAVLQNAEYSENKIKRELKREKILDCLPGGNCGACGYSDCASLAMDIAKGKASPASCRPGGNSVAQAIGVILGNDDRETQRMRAQVMCSGNNHTSRPKYIYDDGALDCFAEMKLGGGSRGCKYACVGMGNCVKVCPFGAISIKDGTAVVDYKLCTGCGNCVTACPKHIIKLIPYDAYHWVGCSSKDSANRAKFNCTVGCTGCSSCLKVCPEQAIEMNGNIASINYDKCSGCGMCYTVCPEGVIWRSDIVGKDGLIFTKGKKTH
ncbi:MAG: 4Fe-4S dicluster domain-containing protein [Ruminococcaceae bacterium]|nr:4Fe-4S dicluster domain-containing protein [Oscillospiraceae bacterium]